MGKSFWFSLIWGTMLGVVTAFALYPAALAEPPAATVINEGSSSQEVEKPKKADEQERETVLPAKAEMPDLPVAEKPVPQPKPTFLPEVIQEETKQEHKNKTLKNININFFGIENGVLQMLTVYSINKENNWKSGTVFVPTNALVPGTKNTTFAELYQTAGPLEIKKILAQNMEIDISYYVMVDRNLLLEMEAYLDPIYVGGEKVNIAQLFTKTITPEDEIILASLLKNLTKPEIFWGILPKLIWTCKKYIETDFPMSVSNLLVHYQIAQNIDTTKVAKKVLPGAYRLIEGKGLWVVDPTGWYSIVYDVTH
ncbi:MAG: hypothetical protein ACOYI2_06980 [Bacillota bacterium]|jgi:anionic cell wall polymer biosynthesis LytR-Cps2A-Psr (LCP) family protein